MRLRVMWWIPIAGVWIAHASGFFQIVGPIFSGIDGAIATVTDIRKLTATAKAPVVVKTQRHARASVKEKHK